MAAKSPADQLKDWTQKLATDQSQNADLAKEIDRLKNQIADLTKTVSDIDQKKQAWEKAAQPAAQQQTDFGTYVKTKTKMLEATVADPKSIADAKAAALKTLDDLQKALDQATATAATKGQAWSDAKTAAAAKASAYSTYAGLAATNDAILKDLAALRTQADKEGAANNVARMYFLVLVMTDVVAKLSLPDADTYTKELNNRASDLAAASETEKLAKGDSDKAVAAVTQAQKDLDDSRSKWRQSVLDAIPNGGAGAAAAPVPAPPPVAAPVVPAPAPPVVPPVVAAPVVAPKE